MSWRPKLNISDGLVDLVAKNPYAEAGRSIGAGLIDLGQRKVKDAKEADIEAKKEQRRREQQEAQYAKNWVFNKPASQQVLDLYSTDKNSPLASPDAPTNANAVLRNTDFGKEEKAKPWKQFKGADGRIRTQFTDGSVQIGGYFYNPKNYKTFIDKNLNLIQYDPDNPSQLINLGKTFNYAEEQMKTAAKYREKKGFNPRQNGHIEIMPELVEKFENAGFVLPRINGKVFITKEQKAHLMKNINKKIGTDTGSINIDKRTGASSQW